MKKKSNRTNRLNSLLKEVISEVIYKDVNNPLVSNLLTVARVSITKDLRYAKVYISVIGEEKEKKDTIDALNKSSGFISKLSSKKVVMRYFPSLSFYLDSSVDKIIKIEKVLQKIKNAK